MAQVIMGTSQPCFHADGKIEYFRLKGDALLYLVELAWRSVLCATKTNRNNHKQYQIIINDLIASKAIDAIKSSSKRQTATYTIK